MATRLRLMPIVALILVIFGADKVQAEAVCSNTLTSGQWVACTEDADSTNDIDIDLQSGVNITTTGNGDHGILGQHDGAGDITINVTGTEDNKTIITEGAAHGVSARSHGKGSIDITVTNVDISTTNPGSSTETKGISARQSFILGDQAAPYDGTYHVKIKVTDSQINTVGGESDGISGYHDGNKNDSIMSKGNLEITTNNTDITTEGASAEGIDAYAPRTEGDIILTVTGGLITTMGRAVGLQARHLGGSGNIKIDLQDVTIKSESEQLVPDQFYTIAHGVFAHHDGDGDIIIDARAGTAISTKGAFSYGLRALAANEGDIQVTTHEGSSITNTGTGGHGIDARNTKTGVTDDTRSITITVGGDITASGENAHGVRIGTGSAGFVGLDEDGYRRQTVTVNGRVTGGSGTGAGIYLSNGGKVIIGPQGSIGADSGIAILATGDDASVKPKLRVDLNLGGRQVVEALGDNWIINDGGETTIAVNDTVLHEGATGIVTDAVAHNGAWNVRMREEGVTVDDRITDPANWVISDLAVGTVLDRDFSVADFNETRRPTPPPPVPPVPESQVHMVEESIIGGANDVAGIHVEGDGMVHIGPMGSVGAQSGIAILATQGTSGSLSNSSPEGLLFGDVIGVGVDLRSAGAVSGIAALTTADGPKLTVDMDLDGRRVQDVIGDDWIINDQGETTIIINGVTLHEGATGIVTDAVAPNGPFNVAMIGEGVMVTDRTDPDPANWLISDPTLGVIADRDFSAEDFLYLSTSGSPLFVEEYAPRAAVYEALPGFLLRLRSQGHTGARLVSPESPESPVWLALSTGSGSIEPDRSTTGAEYDYDRYLVQLGKNLIFGENLGGWFAVHHTQGESDVSSPTGGGDIDVEGAGATLDIQWHHASGYYLDGRTSFTAYDIDLSSDERGRLRSSVDALGIFLGLETGRRMELGESLHLTPRAWLSHSSIDIDSFTDAVDAQASFPDEARLTGGIGALAETMHAWKGGQLTWHGSLDIEQMLNSRGTTATVSGEQLKSETVSARMLLGLGSLYRRGTFSISGQVSVDGLATNDEEYSGQVNIGVRL